jgi:hypothetical protein
LGPGPFLPTMCHHCLLSEPEAPSTDKSGSTRLSHTLQTNSSWPPLVLRFCHREPSFRHAFTYGIRTLDLISASYSPLGLRPHAAYRFLQLRDPRARLPTVLTSSLLRRHALAQRVASPLAEHCQRSFHRSGGFFYLMLPPAAMTAHHGGFTPTYSAPTPPVASWCFLRPGSDRVQRPRGNGLVLNQLARHTAPKSAAPYRAASPVASRKTTSSTAPEMPSTRGSSHKEKQLPLTA